MVSRAFWKSCAVTSKGVRSRCLVFFDESIDRRTPAEAVFAPKYASGPRLGQAGLFISSSLRLQGCTPKKRFGEMPSSANPRVLPRIIRKAELEETLCRGGSNNPRLVCLAHLTPTGVARYKMPKANKTGQPSVSVKSAVESIENRSSPFSKKAPGCLDTLVGVFRRPSGWPLSDCL